MRIDTENHIGKFRGDPYTFLGHGVEPEDLEALLDQYGFDMAVVVPATEQFADNKGLAKVTAAHPRLIGFALINPYADDGGVSELERAVGDWGMRGIKLMPLRHAYEIDGDQPRRLMKRAEELGPLPVNIHSGGHFCLPWQIAALAREFPTVPIIMDHMGDRYYLDGAINVAKEQANIFLQTSIVAMPGYIRLAVDAVGADRVIYGSDYPSGHPEIMLATIRLANLAPADEALVLGENFARILGLESRAGAQLNKV
jgi:uncharacterized protein